MTGWSSGIAPRAVCQIAGGIGRHGEPDLERDVGERLGRGPRAGERAEPGAAAGDDGPVVARHDLEAEAAAKADQGLERVLVFRPVR